MLTPRGQVGLAPVLCLLMGLTSTAYKNQTESNWNDPLPAS